MPGLTPSKSVHSAISSSLRARGASEVSPSPSGVYSCVLPIHICVRCKPYQDPGDIMVSNLFAQRYPVGLMDVLQMSRFALFMDQSR